MGPVVVFSVFDWGVSSSAAAVGVVAVAASTSIGADMMRERDCDEKGQAKIFELKDEQVENERQIVYEIA